MLDLKYIRENPDFVQKGIDAKFVEIKVDELLDLDKERRSLIGEVESLKAERNKANDAIAEAKKSGSSADEIIAEIRTKSQKIKEIDGSVAGLDQKMDQILASIPNIPHKDVSVAPGDQGNQVVKTWGEPKNFDFKPKDHLEISEKLGWLSMDTGSKISGSGFPVFFGKGAKLQRALISMMLDLHTELHGYQEAWPPAIVNRASMKGTGQIPKMEEDMYSLYDPDIESGHGDQFIIPTAEVPVTNFHRNDTFKESDLPVYYAAYAPCFRREAGSYGKDTRGLSRVHQFDKVELVKFVKPENSEEELESLLKNAEAVLQALELPYRVLLLGSGDLSFAAAKCYDLEVWAPGTEKWFEVSSCSLFGDFQSRRMNIKYKNQKTGKSELVHTLNGSGVALARTVLCLLENFQTESGEVDFPMALRKYL